MPLTNASSAPRNPVKAPTGDVPNTILRDQWKRPLIVRPDGSVEGYTRASSIGGVLEDQTGLGYWRMRQAVWGLARRPDLRLAVAAIRTTTTSEDKEALRKLAFDALEAAESKAAATVGTALHALSEQVDAGTPIPPLDDHEQARLDAYARVARGFAFHATEQFTVCDERGVAGTFDRIAEPLSTMTTPDGTSIVPGDRLVWDLKTSGSSDYFGIKFAAQLCAYATGEPYRGWVDRDELARLGEDRDMPMDQLQQLPLRVKKAISRGERLPWPGGIAPRADWGLILHVPPVDDEGRATADLYWVNLTLGAQLLALAVDIQGWRKRKDLVVPAEPPRTPMDTALNGSGLTSLIQAVPAGPGMRDEFRTLWSQHSSTWKPEHTALVEIRLALNGRRSRCGWR